jgi:serine protease AprX
VIPRVIAGTVVLSVAIGTAFAAADDLPTSTPQVYRDASGASTLAGNGFNGQGVTVAIIDTGVADVPGLDGKVIHQENLSAAPAGGDQFGHGTFVAGLVHTVAPQASIVSVKLSGADGSVDVTQVLAALQWVSSNRDTYGIDVVNLSFGNDSKQSAYTSLLNFGVQKLWDEGIVVVASAGNLGPASGTVTKPGDDPVIISVGASDDRGTGTRDDDVVADFVSRGPTQDGLAKPDLVAPGTRLVSLRAPGSTADVNYPQARIGSDQFRGSGTSFSAPIVAGVVAQILSADGSLNPNQVKYGLLKGATWLSGDQSAAGAGTLRASRALQFAKTGAANQNTPRSTGQGSLQADRGSSQVKVKALVEQVDGTVVETDVALVGNHTAEAVDSAVAAPDLGTGETPLDATDTFDPVAYTQASSWGASSWGASQWGASSWGASSWGASSWGASSWGASQWWASSWG